MQSMAVLQSTFTSKPRCRAMQGISSIEVEGKSAHLQRRTPSQGLQMAIAIKGELQNHLPPRGCNCVSQAKKACSASIQTARRGSLRAEAGTAQLDHRTGFWGLLATPEHALIPIGCLNASRMRTAGEGGLSLVFASRAAVPHPARRWPNAIQVGCFSLLFLI